MTPGSSAVNQRLNVAVTQAPRAVGDAAEITPGFYAERKQAYIRNVEAPGERVAASAVQVWKCGTRRLCLFWCVLDDL